MRPGGGSGDKEAPALTGLGPEIRAQSCRWMTLSHSTRWGVAGLGLDGGQGSEIGSRVAARTGTEAHTVVGLLGRRHIRRKTGKGDARPRRNPFASPCQTHATG
ncbi:hypothetical protein NQZ68_017452 [Dissostichus eleginoides]|nr:hypothetical protein NQZ68_017452 [Dissostichus eleginoides]